MLDKLLGRRRAAETGAVLIVGLGRFGSAAALTLRDLGVEVMAVDQDLVLVNRFAEALPHVMQLDCTDPDALRQIGLDSFAQAVVAMGNLEASIITVLGLKEGGVPEVWAKAFSSTHGEILRRIGADHVVYPEKSAGERVAHSIAGHMLDFFEFEDGFAMARTTAPSLTWDRSLADSGVRTRYDITVVGLKRPGQDFIYAVPETVVLQGDQLIISGVNRNVEAFARLL